MVLPTGGAAMKCGFLNFSSTCAISLLLAYVRFVFDWAIEIYEICEIMERL